MSLYDKTLEEILKKPTFGHTGETSATIKKNNYILKKSKEEIEKLLKQSKCTHKNIANEN